MANTNLLLSQIKFNGTMHDIITRTTGDFVTITHGGNATTLTEVLESIINDISNLPVNSTIEEKIEAAVNALEEKIMGGEVDEALDTFKEFVDYVADHEDVVSTLNEAIGNKVSKEDGKGLSANDFTDDFKAVLERLADITANDIANWNNKVDKVEGKGLSTNDFTDEDKAKLDDMEVVTTEEKEAWNAKADTTVATVDADGLMSKEDKARLDGLKGIRYGTEVPVDMKDGELFVMVVEDTTTTTV